MTKKYKIQIIESTIIFITILIYSLIFNNLSLDEVWNYGFSYNIASGLIPYKDFNLVITPLYSFIGASFLSIFGKNIITYYVFNAITITILYYLIKKHSPNNYYIIYTLLLPFIQPNYNLFCILLMLIILTLEDKKINNYKNDYIIGIILGLTFLTKQNIGIYLCIPSLFKKNKKKIIKRIIGFIIPNIFLLIYLLLNDCLYQFIDYTFLGMKSFLKNTNINYFLLIINITTIIILIYKYLKTKDIKNIYLICIQGISFPIIDTYHSILPFIIALSYIIKDIKIDKKYLISTFLLFIIITSTINIYTYKNSYYIYPNNLTIYKYRKISQNTISHINNIKNYVTNKSKYIDNIYIVTEWSYFLKLESNLPINKYDLLNDGNMGKDGEYKIINEIHKTCQEEQCLFLFDKNELIEKKSQYNQEILNYINNTYNERGIISGYTIYMNH